MSSKAACDGSAQLADHNLHTYQEPRRLITIPETPGAEAQLVIAAQVCVGCGTIIVMDPATYHKRHRLEAAK